MSVSQKGRVTVLGLWSSDRD